MCITSKGRVTSGCVVEYSEICQVLLASEQCSHKADGTCSTHTSPSLSRNESIVSLLDDRDVCAIRMITPTVSSKLPLRLELDQFVRPRRVTRHLEIRKGMTDHAYSKIQNTYSINVYCKSSEMYDIYIIMSCPLQSIECKQLSPQVCTVIPPNDQFYFRASASLLPLIPPRQVSKSRRQSPWPTKPFLCTSRISSV